MQTLVLRRQQLTEKFFPLRRQMQMQAAAIVVAFPALDPAAFLKLVGDAGRIGARGA